MRPAIKMSFSLRIIGIREKRHPFKALVYSMQPVIVVFLTILASVVYADDHSSLRQTLAERMPQFALGTIQRIEGTEFLEVQANGHDVFYTNREGSVAFFGTLVDLKSRANLTEQRKQDLLWVDFAALPLDKAIVKVKGNGARKMAVFTDPDCPFCKKLEAELATVSDATIYVFLYPLTELHPDAPRKARLVWCAADRIKAWDDLMLSGTEPPATSPACEDPLASISDFARKLWIRGTPGIVFGSGRLVPGLIPRDQIERHLSEPPRS